ncbi:MAG: hypothetical protein P4L36_22745 [Holophaga sp.]|nr:hypothetical protein [Holophaga sp.]
MDMVPPREGFCSICSPNPSLPHHALSELATAKANVASAQENLRIVTVTMLVSLPLAMLMRSFKAP